MACGLVLGGVSDPAAFKQTEEICVEMGHLFQVQDDYLDCYGDPKHIGKIGTDIYDNKCGWLINTALLICSPAQKKVLEDNYAKKDPTNEKKVKAVFVELKLEEKFRAHEEEKNAKLLQMIAGVKGFPTDILTKLLSKIYKRNK